MSRDGEPATTALLIGGGAAGDLIRSIDWSQTPIGPIAAWPRSLLSMVQTLLHSRHPMFLWWGPELIQLYNDAYAPSFGEGKHPRAMGQRGPECWGEIWPIIGPQIEAVMTRAEPTWHEDALVPIYRNGKIEEVYWTYGYSPVFDDDQRVGGTLVVCTETTSRVIANRRQRFLRRVGERTSVHDAGPALEAAFAVVPTLHEDIPFACLYDAAGACSLVAGQGPGDAILAELGPRVAALSGPARLTLARLIAAGPWPEPVTEVFATPLRHNRALAFGLSSRLSFDDAYREFLMEFVEHIVQAEQRREAFSIRAAAEAERRDLLLQAPVPTALMTGPQHRFELANPRYVEMVGREVVGKTYLEAFPELTDTPLPGILDTVYRTGVPFVTEELLVPIDREGAGSPQPCYFKFSLQPIKDAAGVVFGMMVVAVDITTVVRAREAEVAAHAQLLHAHNERAALVRELETANRAKDEFLAMLGHELRNPLAPIVTALDLARLHDQRRGPEYDVIQRQLDHLIRLVDDLLDVSKVSQGKIELKREDVDIAEVIAKAIEMSAHLIEQRMHKLTVDVAPPSIRTWGDPVRLAQIVANLLTNAARYTEPGGAIAVSARSDGATIEIRVADNGRGIPAELLPKVFDLFFQGHRISERASGGLGLGLTLVKNFVMLHGGSVTAASAGLGHGSELTVTLPVVAAPAAALPPAPAPALRAMTRKRILIVDDNEDAAEMLGEALRMRGFEVAVAHDPAQALQVFPALRPEVAILDIGLPVMSGYELAERMIATGVSGCRFIAVTGYGQEGDRMRTTAAGFAAHLVKPVKIDALLEAIAR